MEKLHFDVIIIGTGVAGLYAALELPETLRILLLAKEEMDVSNSFLAQGGIAAAIGKQDKKEYHIQDTLNAGGGICEIEAVETIVNEAEKNIHELHDLGVDFDLESGELALTKEGGHSRFRILHIDGDATGKGLVQALLLELKKRTNITMMRSFCKDLLVKDNTCYGVEIIETNKKANLCAQKIIVATGGIGSLYGITTNALGATGDGIAMAYLAGATIKDMEFIQFHPTVYYSDEKRRFLISEAVRGEGALLRNERMERFMPLIDKRGELAPRDIVSRAINDQIKHQTIPYVYLDATCIAEEHLMKRFPNIFQRCLEYGKDMRKDMIPVSPAQHYCIGGIRTDLKGRSSIHNLYACGESACTGVHGANRLASNSLLEAVVFAKRAAKDIQESITALIELKDIVWEKISVSPAHDYQASRQLLQDLMLQDAGIVRSEKGLNTAKRKLQGMKREWMQYDGLSRASLEIRNMILVSELIVESALQRSTSVGTHYLEE